MPAAIQVELNVGPDLVSAQDMSTFGAEFELTSLFHWQGDFEYVGWIGEIASRFQPLPIAGGGYPNAFELVTLMSREVGL
jgi:hypothetical protein